MTETNVLSKPIPVHKGRVSEPVRLLGVRVVVSSISKSITFTVERGADMFGAGAVPDCTPVKLVERSAVSLDAVGR